MKRARHPLHIAEIVFPVGLIVLIAGIAAMAWKDYWSVPALSPEQHAPAQRDPLIQPPEYFELCLGGFVFIEAIDAGYRFEARNYALVQLIGSDGLPVPCGSSGSEVEQ